MISVKVVRISSAHRVWYRIRVLRRRAAAAAAAAAVQRAQIRALSSPQQTSIFSPGNVRLRARHHAGIAPIGRYGRDNTNAATDDAECCTRISCSAFADCFVAAHLAVIRDSIGREMDRGLQRAPSAKIRMLTSCELLFPHCIYVTLWPASLPPLQLCNTLASFVDKLPTGAEAGGVLALDLGGTNYRPASAPPPTAALLQFLIERPSRRRIVTNFSLNDRVLHRRHRVAHFQLLGSSKIGESTQEGQKLSQVGGGVLFFLVASPSRHCSFRPR